MNLKGAKVLCTGGAGFIGSHLCRKLLASWCQVMVYDDFSTGDMSNIPNGITPLIGSVCNLQHLKAACKGIDVVFHLAALPSVPRSIKYPLRTHQVNAGGTLNVLVAAVKAGVKRVVYSSSSSVYGDTPTLPKTEDMLPNPASPYAASKLAGEHYCQVFNKVHGLSVVSLRYFNVYGPGQRADSPYSAAIPKFIYAIRRGDPVTIYGDGEQTRDFTFVEDVVDANILAAESDVCGVYNIGSGQQQSIVKVANAISQATGKNVYKVIHGPERVGDVRDSWTAVSKAKRDLGYVPQWRLEAGIRRTVDGTV